MILPCLKLKRLSTLFNACIVSTHSFLSRIIGILDDGAASRHGQAAVDAPLLEEALRTDGYVELFRPSALQPHKRQALIYGRRMLQGLPPYRLQRRVGGVLSDV